MGAIDIISGSTLQQGSAFNGVEFEVHVGHGDVALDQDPPGVLDRWTWSARSAYWRRHLAGVARAGRVLARGNGIANVITMPGMILTSDAERTFAGGGPVVGNPCPTDSSGQVLPHTHADGVECRPEAGTWRPQ